MRSNSFFMLVSVLFIIFILIIITSIIDSSNKQMTHNKLEFIKDSLETEYYKKQLESYPYDHSKIPTDDTIKRNGKPSKSLWR
jgi:ABC-type lipoprotein release transport system permease subunit